MAKAANTNSYKVRSKVYQYPGMAGWHFIGIPKTESADIRKRFAAAARGWGSLPVHVKLGRTIWKTSIFPDKGSGTYLLPLKAEIRKKEEIINDDTVAFTIEVRPGR